MNNNEEEEIEALSGHAPEEEIAPNQIGPADPKGPEEDDDEVGGRSVVKYAMKCYKCSGVSWIDYDTESYKAYRCAPCGSVNVL